MEKKCKGKNCGTPDCPYENCEEPESIEFGMAPFEYGDDYEGGSVEKSDRSLVKSEFWTVEKALVVLRYEAELRTGKEYQTKTKDLISRNKSLPKELHRDVRIKALKHCGYDTTPESREIFRLFMRAMTKEDRAEIFFLKANDLLFKPYLNPVGKSIVSTVFNKDNCEARFTDVSLDGKQGYFIIASPST